MKCNVITDIVLCLKIIHLLLYVVPLRIVRFCCCSDCFLSVRSIFKILLSSIFQILCFLFFLCFLKIVYLLFPSIFYLLSSSISFFFLKFFLKPITSRFSAFDIRQSIKWVSMLNFRKSKISGALHLVSELMVKRQPWFCWVLLIRDRVSSTLEWVWV